MLPIKFYCRSGCYLNSFIFSRNQRLVNYITILSHHIPAAGLLVVPRTPPSPRLTSRLCQVRESLRCYCFSRSLQILVYMLLLRLAWLPMVSKRTHSYSCFYEVSFRRRRRCVHRCSRWECASSRRRTRVCLPFHLPILAAAAAAPHRSWKVTTHLRNDQYNVVSLDVLHLFQPLQLALLRVIVGVDAALE